jgi:hypothetical protein
MQGRHTKLRRELDRLDAPIDTALYRDLSEAGRSYGWLSERHAMVISLTVSLENGVPRVSEADDRPSATEAAAAFRALRPVIDFHRRRWLEDRLDPMLDAMWRADLKGAASSYWKRLRGKGSAPTVKQGLPDVLSAAERWFNADFGALSRLTGIEGPITQSPTATSRRLPEDLPGVRRDVAAILQQSAHAGAPDAGAASYRVDEVAARVDEILAYWQATGAAPPRTAVFSTSFGFIFKEFFGWDLEQGYALLLKATQEALARVSHPAARDLGPT